MPDKSPPAPAKGLWEPHAAVCAILRNGDWLTRERVRFVAAALARLWRRASSAQSGGTLSRHDSGYALQFRLRHDGAGAGIAFVAVDGFVRGFDPCEKTLLVALGLMPLIGRSVALVILVPLGVPAMLAVFMLILRRSEVFAAPMLFSWTSAKMIGERHKTP